MRSSLKALMPVIDTAAAPLEPDLACLAAGRGKDGQAGGEAEGGRRQRQGAAARHAVRCALAPACGGPACAADTWGEQAGSALLMRSQGSPLPGTAERHWLPVSGRRASPGAICSGL